MHRRILIPTDGFALSQAAVEYGVALGKSVGARITVLTVSIPFRTVAVESVMITDTPEQYAKQMAAVARNCEGGCNCGRCELRDGACRA